MKQLNFPFEFDVNIPGFTPRSRLKLDLDDSHDTVGIIPYPFISLETAAKVIEAATKEDVDALVDASDEDHEELRVFLLVRTLSTLEDMRTSQTTREEAVQWMLDTTDHPFSFSRCCFAYGVDPEEMRDRTIDHLRRAFKRMKRSFNRENKVSKLYSHDCIIDRVQAKPNREAMVSLGNEVGCAVAVAIFTYQLRNSAGKTFEHSAEVAA